LVKLSVGNLEVANCLAKVQKAIGLICVRSVLTNLVSLCAATPAKNAPIKKEDGSDGSL